MKIRKMSINGLFDTYDYDINFPDDDTVTIITGPNGYGKTTLLRILYNLSKANLAFFLNLVFSKISIELNDESSIHITRTISANDENDNGKDISVMFEFASPIRIEKSTFELTSKDIARQYRIRQQGLVIEGTALYVNNDSTSNDVEIIRNIAREKKNEEFIMLISEVKCAFITDDRLFYDSKENKPHLESVDLVADGIKAIIKQERDRFFNNSQKVNENMVSRLMDDSVEPLSEMDYQSLAKSLKAKIELLTRFDIADEIKIRPYDTKMSKVLTADLIGIQEKIEPCEGTLNKLKLFYDLLIQKKLANKDILFDKRLGIKAIATSSGERINLSNLSSGEKNEIIMIYDMVFSTDDGAVLLIDEPENSLHVAWKAVFLDDIEALVNVKKLQVIVATHSPTIIGERWSRVYDLYERNGA